MDLDCLISLYYTVVKLGDIILNVGTGNER